MNVLTPYIKARYSILYLTTPEEIRADSLIGEALAECSDKGKIDLITWSFTRGLEYVTKSAKFDQMETSDPIAALEKISMIESDTIIVMHDLHPFLENPKVRRLIRDIARAFRTGVLNNGKPIRRTMIIVAPTNMIHEDLRHDITMIEFTLPDKDTLLKVIKETATKEVIESGGSHILDEIAEACRGLTVVEADDAIAKSIIMRRMDNSCSIPSLVLKEKANAIKKSGILEYYHSSVGMDSVGGLDNLKEWLDIRKSSFSEEAKQFGLPSPRGFLLAGIPGCGKSLLAKAAAAKLNVPLIRLDIGRVYGGIVGASEANMRLAIQTAEALGSNVLWVDEIDKAFAGMMGGGSGDSGVSQRVFGNFITWMQEKTAPVFIVATANRIEGLPPELLRKGRFDEIFFVDLPNETERGEIFKIHVKRRRPNLNLDLDACIAKSVGFSGAEIEEAVISALYKAFYLKTDLSEDLIIDEIEKTTPLSKSRKSEIDAMRTWAEINAVNASRPMNIERVVTRSRIL